MPGINYFDFIIDRDALKLPLTLASLPAFMYNMLIDTKPCMRGN